MAEATLEKFHNANSMTAIPIRYSLHWKITDFAEKGKEVLS